MKTWIRTVIIVGVMLVLSVASFVLCFIIFNQPAAWIWMSKMEDAPESYFNLTESDLDKYPAIRETLNEMGSHNKTHVSREVHWKLGGEIHEYMLGRFLEESNGGDGVYFKYLGKYYEFGVAVT